MKKISNLEEYKFAATGRDEQGNIVNRPITTSDGVLLKTPLNTTVIGGREPMTCEVLKQIDRICDLIDAAQKSENKTLLLEEADYVFLLKKFNDYTNWSPGDHIRKRILKTGEKLEKAEDYDPNPEAGKK